MLTGLCHTRNKDKEKVIDHLFVWNKASFAVSTTIATEKSRAVSAAFATKAS